VRCARRFSSGWFILAALEATVPTAPSSVLLSTSLLPDHLGGEVLATAIVLLFVALFTVLTVARWRVHRRLILPGLKEVQGWERLANAQPFHTDSDATHAGANDVEVRIVAHVPGKEWAELALDAEASDAPHGTVREAVRTYRSSDRGSTVIDHVHAPTIVPFSVLRADTSARIRRSQFRMLGSVSAGAAVAVIIISSM